MFRTVFSLSILTAGVAAFAAIAAPDDDKQLPDQEAMMKPGPHHKAIDSLAGDWTFEGGYWTNPSDPSSEQKINGTLRRNWILGGRFLHEEVKGEGGGPEPFHGLGVLGYDNAKKKYVGAWIDNMTTSLITSEGTFDQDKKTFTTTSEVYDSTLKKMVKNKDVMKVKSPDETYTEMYKVIDGKEVRTMVITMKRKR